MNTALDQCSVPALQALHSPQPEADAEPSSSTPQPEAVKFKFNFLKLVPNPDISFGPKTVDVTQKDNTITPETVHSWYELTRRPFPEEITWHWDHVQSKEDAQAAKDLFYPIAS